jgi:hypothetical protein
MVAFGNKQPSSVPSFLSSEKRLGMPPTQTPTKGTLLPEFISSKTGIWIVKEGNNYRLDVTKNTDRKLQNLLNSIGESIDEMKERPTAEQKLKTSLMGDYLKISTNFGNKKVEARLVSINNLLAQVWPKVMPPGTHYKLVFGPDEVQNTHMYGEGAPGLSIIPKQTYSMHTSTSSPGLDQYSYYGGKSRPAKSAKKGKTPAPLEEVPATLSALVIESGTYFPGTPLSEVPDAARKWLRAFVEGAAGKRFLAEHAAVGSVRKGRGYVYHLRPGRGKTVLDVAGGIDSVQNERGPMPTLFETGGRQYAMWLTPVIPPLKQTP